MDIHVIPLKITKAKKHRWIHERRPNIQRHLTTRKRGKGAHRGAVQALVQRENGRRHVRRLK